MTGSVGRDHNGTWSFRFTTGHDPLTGRRQTRSRRGFATRREAQKALREALGAQDSGRLVRPSARTVRHFMAEWHAAAQAGLRESTWAHYRTYMDSYVLPMIGDTRLSELTPQRLNLLYAHLLREGRAKGPGGLAPKTVQNVHRMMHRALRDAVRWDYLPRNPAEDAQSPRVPRHRPQVWTPEQLAQFLRHVRGDRYYALWLLLATTGLRRGELAGLRVDDLDLERARVTPAITRVVVDGHARPSEVKTHAGERSIALDPATVAALRLYLATWTAERRQLGQTRPELFVRLNGRPLHPDSITQMFHALSDAAGLPRIRLHDVRHSYASAALRAGVPAKVVSERLGHATAGFTLQVYSHVLPGMDQDAANTVADLILGAQDDDATPAHAATTGDVSKGTGEREDPTVKPPVRESVRTEAQTPLEKELTWAKAQVSDGSGGRI